MTTFFSQCRQHARASVTACACVFLLAAGCESKLERYDLSGAVTFQGKPIPAGYIVISPDTEAGNKGPGAAARIVDGRYATLPGRGTIGGPHVMTVFGFDGKEYVMDGGMPNPMGRPICKADIRADLPTENAEHEIDVPGKGR